MPGMDRLDAMAVFVAIAEAGSLSAAARRLDVPLTSVSRKLAALERALDARLVSRTTRRLALTEEGRTYFERCKRILGDVEEAELALGESQSTPAGRLVVSAPTLFGRVCLAPLVPKFLVAHRRVDLDLDLSDRYVDLVDEGVDVALRIGRLADSSLVARRLGEFRRVVCGAPDYLARRGTPKAPDDLAAHDCIAFTMLQERSEWHFAGADGREIAVRVPARLRANSADAVLEAALGGGGLALAPSWQVREHVRAGRLKLVLARFATRPAPIHALYPHARLLSAKTRAFVDFLAAAWAKRDFDLRR